MEKHIAHAMFQFVQYIGLMQLYSKAQLQSISCRISIFVFMLS